MVAVALWLSVGAAPAARLPLRLRLKAPVDISRLPHQARVVAQALKTYGLILADNGSPSSSRARRTRTGTTAHSTSSTS